MSLFKKWSGIIVIAVCFLIVVGCGNLFIKGLLGFLKNGKLYVVIIFYLMYEFIK